MDSPSMKCWKWKTPLYIIFKLSPHITKWKKFSTQFSNSTQFLTHAHNFNSTLFPLPQINHQDSRRLVGLFAERRQIPIQRIGKEREFTTFLCWRQVAQWECFAVFVILNHSYKRCFSLVGFINKPLQWDVQLPPLITPNWIWNLFRSRLSTKINS